MHPEKDGQLDEQHNSRVGTKRYMSPEVLDQSIDRSRRTFLLVNKLDHRGVIGSLKLKIQIFGLI
jgi:hypothetical protein